MYVWRGDWREVWREAFLEREVWREGGLDSGCRGSGGREIWGLEWEGGLFEGMSGGDQK